jgi:hypothetical protein
MIPAGNYIVQYDQEQEQIACDTENRFERPKQNLASASQYNGITHPALPHGAGRVSKDNGFIDKYIR